MPHFRSSRFLAALLVTSFLPFSVGASTAAASTTCDGLTVTISGTNDDDVIIGTDGVDVINAGRGDDRIEGLGGDDVLCGDNGEDLILGGDGNDVIVGGNEDDTLVGGDGDDDLRGGNGNDVLIAGDGDDSLAGDNGKDELYGDDGDDTLHGANGVDALFGNGGDDILDGGNAKDTCLAGETLSNCDLVGESDDDLDGLSDLIEDRLGTSTTKQDTDGDGLTDLFEVSKGGVDHVPTDADSDGDGLGDAEEDVDSDGLNAGAEQTIGSEPTIADTDGDRVNDGDEVAAGTDPLTPDQPVQTVDVVVGDVTVGLTGFGDLSDSVSVTPNTDAFWAATPGEVTSTVDVELDEYGTDNLVGATVTIAYDEANVTGNEADLRLFTWDDEQSIWVPAGSVEQTIDPVANTVTAAVEHFSPFKVVNIEEWLDFWLSLTTCTGGGTGEGGTVEVALVIDSSGSMAWNDPSGLRKVAAKAFVDLLRVDNADPVDNDRAAVVDFDSSAQVFQSLTSDKVALKAAIDRINSSGGTNLSSGVSAALNEFDLNGRADTSQVIVLLTDGVGSYSSSLTSRAADDGVVIFTVGLGNSVSQSLLEAIAAGTDGQYFPVSSASDLEDVFLEIGGEVTGGDSDGDGIPDCDEIEGMAGGNGQTYFSDPDELDTDGDLLADGIEAGSKLVQAYPGAPPFEYYPIISDPSDENSDEDPNPIQTAPDDGFEFTAETKAFLVDSDREFNGVGKSVLDDGTEFLNNLNPLSVDTDGDGYTDYYEFFGIYDETPEDAIAFDLDPLFPDTADLTFGAWSALYRDGFLCGDLEEVCPWVSDDDKRSIPYIIGSIASGFGGPVPDARDVLGNLLDADFIGAGLSAVGFLPIVGDAASGVSKAVRTIKNAPADEAVAALKKIDELPLPQSAKDDILEQVIGGSRKALKDAGLGDESFTIFRKSGVNVEAVADALKNAKPSAIPSPGFLGSWKDGEAILRATGPDFLAKGKGFADPINGGRRNYRIADAWDPVSGVMLESKTGAQRLSSKIRRQIDRDAALVANNADVNKVEWHFFASDISQKIADDPALFEYLTSKGIPYVINLP